VWSDARDICRRGDQPTSLRSCRSVALLSAPTSNLASAGLAGGGIAAGSGRHGKRCDVPQENTHRSSQIHART